MQLVNLCITSIELRLSGFEASVSHAHPINRYVMDFDVHGSRNSHLFAPYFIVCVCVCVCVCQYYAYQ